MAHEPEDYSIFLHRDGIKSSVPWRLRKHGRIGALSNKDQAELAAEFEFPPEIMKVFSKQIGFCLEQDVDTAINLVAVNRATALRRAAAALNKAATLAKRVELDISQMNALLARLEADFAANRNAAALLSAAKQQALILQDATIGLSEKIEMAIKTPGCAADMSPTDKREAWDKRRQYVVETCCHVWIDAGREATHSTGWPRAVRTSIRMAGARSPPCASRC